MDAGTAVNWGAFNWQSGQIADPAWNVTSTVSFMVRTSPDGLTWTAWTSISNGAAVNQRNRYLQYQAALSTPHLWVTPYVHEVRVTYNP